MSNSVGRDERLDAIKFFLIILVAFGHLIEPIRYTDKIAGILYSIIYSFHMPLFVLLSGYFADIRNVKKLYSKSVTLIETYVVVMGVQLLYNRNVSQLFIGENSGWYLLSFISWLYILHFLSNKKLAYLNMFLLSVIVCFLVFSINWGSYSVYLSFMRTFQFLPFFTLGYALKGTKFHVIQSTKTKIAYNILMIIIIGALIYNSSRSLHLMEFHRDHLFTLVKLIDASPIQIYFANALLYLVSFAICFYVLRCLKLPTYFSLYGKYTLAIFTIQGVFTHIYASLFKPSLIESIVVTIILISLSCCVCYKGLSQYVTNPISSVINNIRKHE